MMIYDGWILIHNCLSFPPLTIILRWIIDKFLNRKISMQKHLYRQNAQRMKELEEQMSATRVEAQNFNQNLKCIDQMISNLKRIVSNAAFSFKIHKQIIQTQCIPGVGLGLGSGGGSTGTGAGVGGQNCQQWKPFPLTPTKQCHPKILGILMIKLIKNLRIWRDSIPFIDQLILEIQLYAYNNVSMNTKQNTQPETSIDPKRQINELYTMCQRRITTQLSKINKEIRAKIREITARNNPKGQVDGYGDRDRDKPEVEQDKQISKTTSNLNQIKDILARIYFNMQINTELLTQFDGGRNSSNNQILLKRQMKRNKFCRKQYKLYQDGFILYGERKKMRKIERERERGKAKQTSKSRSLSYVTKAYPTTINTIQRNHISTNDNDRYGQRDRIKERGAVNFKVDTSTGTGNASNAKTQHSNSREHSRSRQHRQQHSLPSIAMISYPCTSKDKMIFKIGISLPPSKKNIIKTRKNIFDKPRLKL